MEPTPLYAELGPLKPRVEAAEQMAGPPVLEEVAEQAMETVALSPAADEDQEEAPRAAGQKGERTGVVNVNTASEEELMRLPGVGPKMAARIVEARERKRFGKASQLRRVKGIGPKKWAKMAGYVVVEGETTLVK
jgi:competence ComEA-like helix-hairpin-helix protein